MESSGAVGARGRVGEDLRETLFRRRGRERDRRIHDELETRPCAVGQCISPAQVGQRAKPLRCLGDEENFVRTVMMTAHHHRPIGLARVKHHPRTGPGTGRKQIFGGVNKKLVDRPAHDPISAGADPLREPVVRLRDLARPVHPHHTSPGANPRRLPPSASSVRRSPASRCSNHTAYPIGVRQRPEAPGRGPRDLEDLPPASRCSWTGECSSTRACRAIYSAGGTIPEEDWTTVVDTTNSQSCDQSAPTATDIFRQFTAVVTRSFARGVARGRGACANTAESTG